MNKNSCFIDTGAYIAAFHRRDQHHSKALKIWKNMEECHVKLITSNHILDEVATLLGRRTSYQFAALKLKSIYADPTIHIERSNHTDELRALNFFEKYADQKISFTDCISFSIMERLYIKQVFGFDRHFQYLGFELFEPDN